MVSVIITTYGACGLLTRAIDSVLQQDYDEIEVIVVDDNDPETDERALTEKVMSQYSGNSKVRYIKHEKNKNGAAARNTGIEAAHGFYIAFLDDDDFFLPGKVSASVSFMEKNPDLIGVCQEVVRIKNNKIIQIMNVENEKILTVDDILVSGAGIGSGSNIFLKKEAIIALGGFDEAFTRKQDIEFMLRIIKSGKVSYLHDIQIVKDVSGVRKLNYKNNKNSFIQFNKKFDEDIVNLSEEKREKYFFTQYTFLLGVALSGGEKSEIKLAAAELSSMRSGKALSRNMIFKDRMKRCVPRIIATGIQRRKYDKSNRILSASISKDRYDQIKRILQSSSADH